MAMVDECDKLFTYLVDLNRKGRSHGTGENDEAAVRDRLTSLISEIKGKVDSHVCNYRVMNALEATADWLVSCSKLTLSQTWQKRGFDPDPDVTKFTLDREFWDGLEHTLAEPQSNETNERLEVFAVCIGIGYIGEHVFLPDHERFETIRREMRKIWARIKGRYDYGDKQLITPDTYKYTKTADLRPPRVSGTTTYVIILAVAFIGLLFAQIFLYSAAKRDLSSTMKTLTTTLNPQSISTTPVTPVGGEKR